MMANSNNSNSLCYLQILLENSTQTSWQKKATGNSWYKESLNVSNFFTDLFLFKGNPFPPKKTNESSFPESQNG